MQPGRNDPCPCGSGKKYKRCCLPSEPTNVADPVSKLRAVQQGLERRLSRFGAERFGEASLRSAWDEFSGGAGAFDPDSPELQLFFPWFLYDWRCNGPDTPGLQREAAGSTIAQLFLESQRSRMEEAEHAFIEAARGEPLSFFEVIHVDPARGLWLKDILRGVEYDVAERTASVSLARGDIVFARVVRFPDCALLVGLGSTAFPPTEKESILALRKSLRSAFGEISADLLRDLCPQILSLYLTIRDRVLNPPRPQLCNTDGDVLLLHTLTYQVESAEAALHALQSLHAGSTAEELRQDSKLNSDGSLRGVVVTWTKKGNKLNKHWDNTILGHLEISRRTLTVNVNSAKRAKKIQSEIQRRLGPRAVLLKTEIQSSDAAFMEATRHPRAQRERQGRSEELNARPEVQTILKQAVEAHWQDWPDQKIPALGGKTPLQAVRDVDGREMVEALLLEAERYQGMAGQSQPPYDFDRLRERLGLKSPPGGGSDA